MKNLIITWRRLVENAATCPRCGSTEKELAKAVLELSEKLKSQNIEVILKKEELTLAEFQKNPIQSNAITFNGVALEDLLQAKIGTSKCCDVCGDAECRTVEVAGKNHEVISAELIIKAGSIAAGMMQ